ncbi:hypothetical protein ACE7GA_25540 [Roseomonas sp. CCTCC AB2023176]|uniref:hypothetical protein n=1 Tax=Roseomonas sp. CCTCC AB2023176 TaxID=3342640 RepID=UPI0035E342B2
MAQHIDPMREYADARRVVLQLDVRRPPRPLPERVCLTTDDLYDPDFGPDDLIARIAEGPGTAV